MGRAWGRARVGAGLRVRVRFGVGVGRGLEVRGESSARVLELLAYCGDGGLRAAHEQRGELHL